MSDRIDYDERDSLDDVVINDVSMFRLEYMSPKSVWIKCYRENGEDVVFWLHSNKRIRGRHQYE